MGSYKRYGSSEPPFNVDDTILDRYRVVEVLGALGSVWYLHASYNLAPQIGFAIQVLPADRAANEGLRAAFLDEAARLMEMPQPPFIPVIRTATLPEGHVLLVREMLEGRSIRGATPAGELTPVKPVRTMRIVECVVNAMSAAHRRGFAMQGFTPYDLLLSTAMSADQFAAYILHAPFEIGSLCLDDERVNGGLARYHAPEFRADPRASVAADVYALGALMSALLWGARGDEMLREPETFDFGAMDAFRPTLLRALAREPAERFPGVDSFMSAARGAAWRTLKSSREDGLSPGGTRVFARRER